MEPVFWIVLGVVLAVAEMFTGTFVLIMLAAGAAAAALGAAVGAPVPVQTVIFAVVSALALVAIRPAVTRRRQLPESAGAGQFGVEAIEGSTGLVLEQVDADSGLVKIDGELWAARAYDGLQVIGEGERVRVVELRGATVMVWRES